MGIAWIQTFNNSIIHQFPVQIQNLLSLLQYYQLFVHVLEIALFTYILIYNLLSRNTRPFYMLNIILAKYIHTTIGLFGILFYILSNYIHIITLHKFLAHSDNKFNNLANQLAKN